MLHMAKKTCLSMLVKKCWLHKGLAGIKLKGKESKSTQGKNILDIWDLNRRPFEIFFCCTTRRTGYIKLTPEWFEIQPRSNADILYSEHRHAWQPIDIV